MVGVRWVSCPVCGNKTRTKVREDTVLENFPLFCPKCKVETVVEVRQLTMKVIKECPTKAKLPNVDIAKKYYRESDAQTQSR